MSTSDSARVADSPVRRLHDLAAVNHGLFTRAEALATGLSGISLSRRVRDGYYLRVAPGIYRVRGHPETWVGDVAAATRLTGGLAAARTALALHGVSPTRRAGQPTIVVPYTASARTPVRARILRSRTLGELDRTEVAGIASCTVSRALVDHGREATPTAWRELVAESVRMRIVTLDEVAEQLGRAGPVPARASMRAILAAFDPAVARSRSGAETRFLELVTKAGLPRPVLNYELRDTHGDLVAELDAAYVDWWQAFEIDGAPFHALPAQLEHDEVKDLRVRELGWDVRRIPARALTRNPRWVLERVRAAIDDARATYPVRRRAADAHGARPS